MWRQSTVFSGQRRPPLTLDGTRVLFLEHPRPLRETGGVLLGVRKVERRGHLLRVTGPERTLVEGFRRPYLVGGVSELAAVAGGELRPEILLPEAPDLVKIVAAHPAIRWKVENMRKHRRAKNRK